MHPTPGPLTLDAASGLSYRLAQPEPGVPQRLLVLLHGVGSNELDLLGLAQGLAPPTLVASVRGPLTLGPQQFAWFQVAFTPTGPRIAPEQAEHSRLALIDLVQSLQTRFGVRPAQTVVAGFSQGGIMSASVALSAPHVLAGFGLLSGRILPELAPHLAPPEQLRGLKAFVGHGEHDSKLPVTWAHKSHDWLTQLGVDHEYKLYPMDHGISAAMQSDFLAWCASVLGA